MRKKILLVLFMCLCLLGLSACQADPKKADYNGHTYGELEQNAQGLWTTLDSMDEATMEQYLASEDEVSRQLVSSWQEIRSDLGAYKETGDLNVIKAKDTLTTELTVEYEKRPIKVTIVYKYSTMAMEDITVEPVFSLSEKLQKALLNLLMGMGTVFIMLILISLIISCFRFIAKWEQRNQTAKQEVQTPVKQAEVPVPMMEEAVPEDDFELVAVITAAVAASAKDLGVSADGFVVRSIKRRR